MILLPSPGDSTLLFLFNVFLTVNLFFFGSGDNFTLFCWHYITLEALHTTALGGVEH